MTEDMSKDVFTYEVVDEWGTLSENSRGWTKRVNLIAYNGNEPMLDVRRWSPDGKMSKGITLTRSEALALKGILNSRQLEEF